MFKYTKQNIFDIAIDVIANNYVHEYYQETVDIANYWRSIVIGEGQEQIVLKKNESKRQKEQRLKLFNTHTPYLSNRLKTIFQEVDRCDNINEIVDIKPNATINEDIFSAFLDKIKTFQGVSSLDDYLDDHSFDQVSTDPNSFLLLDFYPFDPEIETPTFYPVIIKSEDVIYYEYENETLQYILFRERVGNNKKTLDEKYKYIVEPEREKFKYYVYTPNESFVFIPQGVPVPADPDFRKIVLNSTNGNQHVYFFKESFHGSNQVPVHRLGYNRSLKYNYKINESCLFPAKQLFNEHIQKKSTYDNHIDLYGFLRAYFYVPKCKNVEDGYQCVNGQINGSTCSSCGGSGKEQIARSEQDIFTLEIPLPDEMNNPAELLELSRLVHYVDIPSQVIEMNRQEIDYLSRAISLSLFNTNVFDRKELIGGTATEIKALTKNVNNVLYHFALFKSRLWQFVVDQMSRYMGIKDAVVCARSYPSDFKIETLSEELAILNSAKASGASIDIISKIEDDIINRQYVNQPDRISWIRLKNKFRPFADKTETEESIALSLLPSTAPKKILWLYFDDIFRDIAQQQTFDFGETQYNAPFVELTYHQQKDVLNRYVDIYLEQTIQDESIDIPFGNSDDVE